MGCLGPFKHVEINRHFIKKLENGQICIPLIPTQLDKILNKGLPKPVDIFTKGLPKPAFDSLTNKLGFIHIFKPT